MEAKITINGRTLTEGQAMTVRVAVTDFLSEMSKRDPLGSDATGRAMASGYSESATAVLRLMGVIP